MSDTMRMFKVTRPGEGSGSWISRDLATVQDAEFDGAKPGDKITIELVEMTEQELDALPEFAGWLANNRGRDLIIPAPLNQTFTLEFVVPRKLLNGAPPR